MTRHAYEGASNFVSLVKVYFKQKLDDANVAAEDERIKIINV